MAIIKGDPRPIIAPREKVGKDIIVHEGYRHAVVDSKVQVYTNLLTHLSGSKWRGWLYTQVKGADEAVAPFQVDKEIPLQQYKLVKDYECLLQGNLSETIDEKGEVQLTGTVITYPYWMVNYGDMWVADIGEGKAGLFTVTGVTKKTRFKETVYELQIKLQQPMTAELARQLSLYVQETYHFDRDYLKYGQNPYVVSDEYHSKLELEKMLSSHHEIYLNTFMDWQVKSFRVPLPTTSPTYDPFVVRAVTNMIDLMEFNILPRMNRFNMSEYGIENTITLFDCLLDYKPEMLKCTAMRKARLLPARSFKKGIRFAPFAFSGFAQAVVPAGGVFDNSNIENAVGWLPWGGGNGCGCPTTTDCGGVDLDLGGILGGGGMTVSDGTEGTVLPHIHKDGFYILSEAFYNHDIPNMTKFERLLWLGIEHATINASDVLPYYRSFCNWSLQDKFFLGPLLFILTAYALRTVND